jgi:hypothetical protein
MRFPHGGGPGFGLYSIFADVAAGLAFILGFVIVVGLIVLLVRFLLVATRAAELYVANNRPAEHAVTPTPVTPEPPAPPAPEATSSVATTPVVAPARTSTPRTRTPKPPTA